MAQAAALSLCICFSYASPQPHLDTFSSSAHRSAAITRCHAPNCQALSTAIARQAAAHGARKPKQSRGRRAGTGVVTRTTSGRSRKKSKRGPDDFSAMGGDDDEEADATIQGTDGDLARAIEKGQVVTDEDEIVRVLEAELSGKDLRMAVNRQDDGVVTIMVVSTPKGYRMPAAVGARNPRGNDKAKTKKVKRGMDTPMEADEGAEDERSWA